MENSENARKVIFIDGEPYDVTNFIAKHPGGRIIEDYINAEAGEVFRAFHSNAEKLLRCGLVKKAEFTKGETAPKCTQVKDRYFVYDKIRVDKEEWEKDYYELYKTLKEKGYFDEKSIWKLLLVIIRIYCLFFTAIILAYNQYHPIICALFFGLSWQQSGIILHDAGHNASVVTKKWNRFLAWLFGCVHLGVSSSWWKWYTC